MLFGLHLPDIPPFVGLAAVASSLLLMVVTAYYVRRVSGLRKANEGLRTKVAELSSKLTVPAPTPAQQTPTLELMARVITAAAPIILAIVGLSSPYLKSWADTRTTKTDIEGLQLTLKDVLGANMLEQLHRLPAIKHEGITGRELSVENQRLVEFAPSERTILKFGSSPAAIIDPVGAKKLVLQLPDSPSRVIVIPLPTR